MKTLSEALFSRKNIKSNPYGLTEEDLKGSIKSFPIGVVVRMLEEQELQGNRPNVKVFQNDRISNKFALGFEWEKTKAGTEFWLKVLIDENWEAFFKIYPEYKKYNLK